MREAIISLGDEELKAIGYGKGVTPCRQARIREGEFLEDDGTRRVTQIAVENWIGKDRLDTLG